jgi:acyl-CoA synthetase (AMP-forming)/AMP-acid ligase II
VGYWNRPHETTGTFCDCVDGSSERWLRTGDLGFLSGGDLHVTGRIKDLLIVRGTKHFPQDLERTAERQHHSIRPGAVAAVAVANGVRGDRIALVAEVDSRQLDGRDGHQLITDLRQAIADSHGIQLHGVALVPPGTVPRTTSGKLQRFLCREAWLSRTLEPLALWCDVAPERT